MTLTLHAVKSLLEKMRGVMRVESTLGKGSCFILEVPLVVSYSQEAEGKDNHFSITSDQHIKGSLTISSNTNSNATKKSAIKILVVEDNRAASMMLRRVLFRLGHASMHASTGNAAIAMARATKYDIIFMDIGLPDISGFKATEKIRKFSGAPIIAITGHVDKLKTCIEAGMQELLAKPAMQSSIESLLDRYTSLKQLMPTA